MVPRVRNWWFFHTCPNENTNLSIDAEAGIFQNKLLARLLLGIKSSTYIIIMQSFLLIVL